MVTLHKPYFIKLVDKNGRDRRVYRNRAGEGALWMRRNEFERRFQEQQQQPGEPTMLDRVSLEAMGFIFGGITAVVIAIAAFVVGSQVSRAGTQVAFDQRPSLIPVALTPQR
jgi:hypothetical protein